MITKKKYYSIVSVTIIMMLLSGCFRQVVTPKVNYDYVAEYNYYLTSVERPADAKLRYGEQVVDKYNPQDSSKFNYIFEDGLVKILWLPSQNGFYFQIYNKTDHSIKIVWSEAVFVDENNLSHGITQGTGYITPNDPQPPSVIIRKGSFNGFVLPTENMYRITHYGISGWLSRPMLDCKSEDQLKTDKEAKQLVGKKLQLLIPLEIQGTVNEYIFEFTAKEYKIVQKERLF